MQWIDLFNAVTLRVKVSLFHSPFCVFEIVWCTANFRTLSHLKTHVSRKHTEVDTNALTPQNTSRAAAARIAQVPGATAAFEKQSAVAAAPSPATAPAAPATSSGNPFGLHSIKLAGFKVGYFQFRMWC
jgi:hypothetical protein